MSSHVSQTALKIARFLLLLDSIPRLRGVLPPGAAQATERILLASGAVRPSLVRMMRGRSALRLYEAAERLTGHGQLLWFGVRKRWMADSVHDAVRAGGRQLLVVGAGFDPLAALAARTHPELLCVELDAPATAGPKQRGIIGAQLGRENHHVCVADLSRVPLAEALSSTPWRTDVLSVVVAEGLLMYLPPEAVRGFFHAVRGCTPAGTRLAFSAMDADAQGRPKLPVFSGLGRWLLRLVGEPLRWGIRPADVSVFLQGLGFEAQAQLDAAPLRARYLEPLGLHDEPLLPYEHLVLAARLP